MKTKMHLRASSHLFGFAKSLRQNPTHAEAILWERLRGNQTGFKFRRQHPLHDYIVDFYCLSLRFAIEVDGSIHEDPMKILEDENKDINLEANGIHVLRLTNDQVIYEIDQVMLQIHSTITHLSAKFLSIDDG